MVHPTKVYNNVVNLRNVSWGGFDRDSTLSVRSIPFTGRGTLELLPFDEDSDAVELSTLGIYRSRTFERELLLYIAVCWCYFGL